MVEKYKSGSCHEVYSLRYKPGTVSLCMASATGALTLLSFAFITIITLVITIIIFINTTITLSSTFTGGLSSAFCKTLLLDVLLQLQFAHKFYCNLRRALYWKNLNILSIYSGTIASHVSLRQRIFSDYYSFFCLKLYQIFFTT